jgi:hypothetical protein
MHSTFNLDDGYMGSGTIIRHSINKYGKENHTTMILEHLDDRVSLKAKEREIVNSNILQDPSCMNIQLGGSGGEFRNIEGNLTSCDWTGRTHTKKSKDKISLSMKGKSIGNKNSQYDTCWITNEKESKKIKKRDLIPDGWKLGRTLSNQTGINNSQYGTCYITNEKESKKIMKGDPIPEGWRLGRKIKF